jgi:ElaA protein
MIEFRISFFDQLKPAELHGILKLRSEIFVVEQQCIYPDVDDKDIHSHHAFGILNNKIVACSRIVAPGISYQNPSIGRVAVCQSQRGKNYGKLIMEKSIESCRLFYPRMSITISAQSYLEKFYFDLGFKTISEPYLEDNIPHIKMLLENK